MALKPTNDPLAVMRRAADDDRRATNNALDAGGTQPEQVVRKLRATVEQQGILINQMVELFNRMPQNDGRQVDEAGWTINEAPVGGPWKTIATAKIPRPANMNRVAVSAVASATGILNEGSFGAMQARILINGAASAPREGAMELMARLERCTVQTAFFREISNLNAQVTVELQLRGRYSDFATSNTAGLTVSAGFTRVG